MAVLTEKFFAWLPRHRMGNERKRTMIFHDAAKIMKGRLFVWTRLPVWNLANYLGLRLPTENDWELYINSPYNK